MLRFFDLVGQVASSRSTVLIQGEKRTAKSFRQGHSRQLPRKSHPFVPVNTAPCPRRAGITLFGHVKGAFTTLCSSKKGLLKCGRRHHFPGEIGTMSLETRPRSCVCFRTENSCIWAACRNSRWMSGSSPPPTLLEHSGPQGKVREDLFYV